MTKATVTSCAPLIRGYITSITLCLECQRARQSPTFYSKSSNFLAETMNVDGHTSGTVGPNLLIFGWIGANIVNFDNTGGFRGLI